MEAINVALCWDVILPIWSLSTEGQCMLSLSTENLVRLQLYSMKVESLHDGSLCLMHSYWDVNQNEVLLLLYSNCVDLNIVLLL